MTTTITIGADVFTALGETPRVAKFTFTPTALAIKNGRLISADSWTIHTDEDGNATTQLPDAVVGEGVRIWSNLQGFEKVTVANYPDGSYAIVDLIADYVVDSDTLGPSAPVPEAAWWGALQQRVLTVNGFPADSEGNVNTDGSDVDIADLALVFNTALI
jgi:hypothetical protein